MEIVIIDYNAGNTCSVGFALERLGIIPVLTGDPERIIRADKVIFPGVGAAGAAMQQLKVKGIDKIIPDLKQPVLGICLGMQLMCSYSEEQDTQCLGIFPGTVRKFRGNEKVPHTGWNNIGHLSSSLFGNITEGAFMYYVHSYYIPVNDQTIASTEYIHPFSASLNKNNFYAVQFHPEKSGVAGSRIIDNFLKL